MTEDLGASLRIFIESVRRRKAVAPVLLDVRELTSLADAFLICSGRSSRQVSAIAEHVKRDLKERGIRPLSVEGEKEGHWVLMDYGSLIIHIFYDPMRDFYDLEGLWSDAPRMDLDPGGTAGPAPGKGDGDEP